MDKKELPMYKDKPYNYAGSRKYTPFYRQKRVISGAILIVIGLAYWFGIFSPSVVKSKSRDTNKSAWDWLSSPTTPALVDWDERREKVKEAFMLTWDGYEQYAWGTLSFSRAIQTKNRLFIRERIPSQPKTNELTSKGCRLR